MVTLNFIFKRFLSWKIHCKEKIYMRSHFWLMTQYSRHFPVFQWFFDLISFSVTSTYCIRDFYGSNSFPAWTFIHFENFPFHIMSRFLCMMLYSCHFFLFQYFFYLISFFITSVCFLCDGYHGKSCSAYSEIHFEKYLFHIMHFWRMTWCSCHFAVFQ